MKKLTVLFLILILSSCDRKFIADHFYNLENSTKIVIEEQDKMDYKPGLKFSKNENKYIITKNEEIKNFNSLLKKTKHTGYCCCPEENYVISFYNLEDNFQTFYVDTVAFKDKVQIFESGYQYSYLVDKLVWKAILKQ
jgi:hypothetical protein